MKSLLFAFIVCPFLLINTVWKTNLEESLEEAFKTDKNVLLVFSGSDWCKPCIQLKKNVLNSKEFEDFSKNKYILVNLDFKRNETNLSKKNRRYRDDIAEKYNPEGKFPFIIILNSKGKVLKEIEGYKGQSSTFFINEYLN